MLLNGEEKKKMRNKLAMSVMGILFVGSVWLWCVAVKEYQPYWEDKVKQKRIVEQVTAKGITFKC